MDTFIVIDIDDGEFMMMKMLILLTVYEVMMSLFFRHLFMQFVFDVFFLVTISSVEILACGKCNEK